MDAFVRRVSGVVGTGIPTYTSTSLICAITTSLILVFFHVPGILPSQLEILYMDQAHFEIMCAQSQALHLLHKGLCSQLVVYPLDACKAA